MGKDSVSQVMTKLTDFAEQLDLFYILVDDASFELMSSSIWKNGF